ncbi:MAG: hypothetical protein GF393_08705 [Armatimonadia bacterium]|nr:hypothetical protein [Armatimonadia bacterium]
MKDDRFMRIDNEVNLICARDPQPGDWWHEMLCAACLVIDRDGDQVRVCRTKRSIERGWQWDLAK